MKIKGRVISLTAFFAFFTLLISGCSPVFDENKKPDATNISESLYYEDNQESVVYYNQGENLVEMKISQANSFDGGYAYLCLESPGIKEYYNAITDKNGNITFFQEINERGMFINSNNGYFYFYRNDNVTNISCVKYDGEEIYKIEMPETENVLNYSYPVCGDDGSVLLYREVTSFDYSGYEIAWVGGSGDFILNWTKLNTGNTWRQVKELDYCGNGFAIVQFFEGSPMFINLKTGYQCIMDYINGTFTHGEFMEGYMLTSGGIVISETGEKVYEISDDNWDLTGVYKGFDSESSHALVLNSKDYSLYDSSMTRKCAELKIPETAKKGYTMWCSSFIDGRALLVLPDSNGKYYFTVIDTDGNMKFEPKRIPQYAGFRNMRAWWDGNFVMIVDIEYQAFDFSKASFFDLNGNLVNEINFENTEKSNWHFMSGNIWAGMSEGMTIVRCTTERYNEYNYGYLKTDGTYLFENGTVSVDFGH